MPDATFLHELIARLSGGFVLAFHEIAPDRFAELVECIRPCKAIQLAELVRRAKRHQSTSGLFAITVDDGVGQNVKSLCRVLKDRGWPGTFYLPTQYIDTGNAMPFQWWRRIEPLLLGEVLALPSGVLDLSDPAASRHLGRKMRLSWHTQPQDSYVPLITEILNYLEIRWGIGKAALEPPPPLTWSEVEELSKNDLYRFESHGITHTAMSALTRPELVLEMEHSRAVISEHTGRECRHFAYPFGSPRSISALAQEVAHRYYDSAATMSEGCLDGANPWLLPRIPLFPKNSQAAARFKVFLKCNAMSPVRT